MRHGYRGEGRGELSDRRFMLAIEARDNTCIVISLNQTEYVTKTRRGKWEGRGSKAVTTNM